MHGAPHGLIAADGCLQRCRDQLPPWLRPLAARSKLVDLSAKRFEEALLFEKRSKNFCTAVADWSATAVQKFFGSFFQKRTTFLDLITPAQKPK
jgi:hypothetical protein